MYIGKKTARFSLAAAIFTFILVLFAFACVALAVVIAVEHRFPIEGGILPGGPVLQTMGIRTSGASAAVTPRAENAPTGIAALLSGIFDTYAESPSSNESVPATTPFVVPEYMPAFQRLTSYLPENAEYYWEWYISRPYMDIEEIVWRVNVGLHRPFYTGIQVNTDVNPLLITPQFRLPYGFAPHALVPVMNEHCPFRATPETVAAFRVMKEAVAADGIRLVVASAYRSAARQLQIWTNGGSVDGAVARAYHSEHQTGRALDLADPAGGLLDRHAERVGLSPTGQWVADNAHRYGFIVRYGLGMRPITGYIFEPWHITFVGMDISFYMHEAGLTTLEEFVGRNPHVTLPPPQIQ
jgi:hypothetical protein